ncbi:hypothetical protein AX15_004674 [Amanita polypyramis BW_CC]|nr:hypothetical protein AX15_004674 [Amanita polypyramis BW_CC]
MKSTVASTPPSLLKRTNATWYSFQQLAFADVTLAHTPFYQPLAVRQALAEAKVNITKDIDGVAFTRGPGIGGCLSVGSNAAKSLAAALGKPLVGVHHMQAHALTPLLTTWPNPPMFPFLTLLISGGHTLLLLANSSSSFKILATTSDESIGRAFDKVSRMLGLNWTTYGPGAALEQFSAEEDSPSDGSPSHTPPFPRPMPGRLAFSYASFHSHVERYIFARGGADEINTTTKRSLARAFQEAAVTQLLDKLLLGLEWCEKQGIQINAVVVSGGVASNHYLRDRFSSFSAPSNGRPTFVYPPPQLCTDNAVMIGWASMTRFLVGDHDDYTINLLSKWSIEAL